jgi:anaphase-promoting complex subunit 3
MLTRSVLTCSFFCFFVFCFPQIAVRDLEYLRDSSPDESNVIFQLAKAYRLIGDEVKSARMLAIARDISPKSAKKIQKLLETVKDEETGGEEMDEG